VNLKKIFHFRSFYYSFRVNAKKPAVPKVFKLWFVKMSTPMVEKEKGSYTMAEFLTSVRKKFANVAGKAPAYFKAAPGEKERGQRRVERRVKRVAQTKGMSRKERSKLDT
jgi:hypothetical protein